MLLNEFLKEHQAFVEEQRKVERLEKQVAALTAGLQKVSAEMETNRAAPQPVRVSAVALRERKNNQ
jgi:molecular chaperone GrpE (heat shock protein)